MIMEGLFYLGVGGMKGLLHEKYLKLRAVHVYGTYRTPERQTDSSTCIRTPLLGLGLSSIEPCEPGQATLNTDSRVAAMSVGGSVVLCV